ncbi:MAG: GNAT family N-acetyltransferase [Candidatus Cloacimonetes bacterium]|nr:GNAT family N-acetyltransferase [Candidatus Cloacimonadota bacterium]
MTFEVYCLNYLGIKKNKNKIVTCKRRSDTFCNVFKQLLIMSKFNNNFYYSIAPEFVTLFKDEFNIPNIDIHLKEHLFLIDDTFSNFIDEYRINKMYRLTLESSQIFNEFYSENVQVLNNNNKDIYLKLFGERSSNYLEKKWIQKRKYIEEGRYFVYIEQNEIAAYSFISDIDNGGANLVVVTLPKFRKKGYGKAVVTESVKWCFNNNILPIYLVDQSNLASIKLAKSLGFQEMAEEIIVTINK